MNGSAVSAVVSITVPDDAHGERVDLFLASALHSESRATIQRWVKEGRVEIDGAACSPKSKLRARARVEVRPGPSPLSVATPDTSVRFEVVYSDAHLIVVNKPPHLVVHPARGHYTGTLVNGLLALPDFGVPPADPRDPEGFLRPGIVHRIDKGTSGLLVVAKDGPTREGLKEQFAQHSLRRSYVALCFGAPPSGTVSTTHGRHPTSRIKFTSLGKEGKNAETQVECIESLAGRASLVRCRLKTGRTHQIRVHLTEQLGTPLIGDSLYSVPGLAQDLKKIADELGRPALHAAELGFTHPISQEPLHFSVDAPEDFQNALSQLRALLALT